MALNQGKRTYLEHWSYTWEIASFLSKRRCKRTICSTLHAISDRDSNTALYITRLLISSVTANTFYPKLLAHLTVVVVGNVTGGTRTMVVVCPAVQLCHALHAEREDIDFLRARTKLGKNCLIPLLTWRCKCKYFKYWKLHLWVYVKGQNTMTYWRSGDQSENGANVAQTAHHRVLLQASQSEPSMDIYVLHRHHATPSRKQTNILENATCGASTSVSGMSYHSWWALHEVNAQCARQSRRFLGSYLDCRNRICRVPYALLSCWTSLECSLSRCARDDLRALRSTRQCHIQKSELKFASGPFPVSYINWKGFGKIAEIWEWT